MVEVNNKAGYDIDTAKIEEVIEKFLLYFKKEDMEVSVALVGDAEIREWNKTYRGKDAPTDILAFPAGEEELESGFLGEILIDQQQVARQAPDFGNTAEEEFLFILVHGLLHLLGYTDQTEGDKKEMIELGRNLIKELNISF